MRCILCDRPLLSAAVTLPGRTPRAIGPKCAKRAGLIKPKQQAEPVVRDRKTVDWVEAYA